MASLLFYEIRLDNFCRLQLLLGTSIQDYWLGLGCSEIVPLVV
jgi:hypothetical protein